MSTAIVKHEETGVSAWHHPETFDRAWQMAQILAKSGAVPQEYQGRPEAVFAAAAFGAEVGLSVMQSVRLVNVIKGKATLGADGKVGICLAHPEICEYFREIETTDEYSIWETKRVGNPPKQYKFTFKEAEEAGFTSRNPNWKTQRGRMLRARAKSFLAGDVYPDLCGGIPSTEEMKDVVDSERAQRDEAARQQREAEKAKDGAAITVTLEETAPPPSTAAPATPQESAPPPAPAADPVPADDPEIKGKRLSAHTLDELKAMEDGFLDLQKTKPLNARQATLLALIQRRLMALESPVDAQIESLFGGDE